MTKEEKRELFSTPNHRYLSKNDIKELFHTPGGGFSMKLFDKHIKGLDRDHAADIMCNVLDYATKKNAMRLEKKYCRHDVIGELFKKKVTPLNVRDQFRLKPFTESSDIFIKDLYKLLTAYSDITGKEFDFLVQNMFINGFKESTIEKFRHQK